MTLSSSPSVFLGGALVMIQSEAERRAEAAEISLKQRSQHLQGKA